MARKSATGQKREKGDRPEIVGRITSLGELSRGGDLSSENNGPYTEEKTTGRKDEWIGKKSHRLLT